MARTLEQRWEASLADQQATQRAYDEFRRERPVELSAEERAHLLSLSSDIATLWHDRATTSRQRQEIMRCLIERVTITIAEQEQRVAVSILWTGGYLSQHEFRRPVHAHRLVDNLDALTARAIELRRAGWRAPRIAAQLNAEGFITTKQRGPFNAAIVGAMFRRHGPAAAKMAGCVFGTHQWKSVELAQHLNMTEKKLKDWVRRGWVAAIQRPFGGLWILWADEEELQRLSQLAQRSRRGCSVHPATLTATKPLPAVC